MTRRLLHFSDTHFGTENPEVCRALIGLAHQLSPDVMVWSGDITQRATPEQFRAAVLFARNLPLVPLLVIPGNHDLPLYSLVERLLAPYQRYRAAFGHALQPCFDAAGWQLTSADTTRRWRQQQGALSLTQIDRVAQRLRRAERDVWRIVVTHHPLVVNRDDDLADRPWRHRRALRTWAAAGMQVLLGGHTHVPFIARGGNVADGAAPWLIQSGTAVSRRTRHGLPNSVTLLVQESNPGPMRRWAAQWDYAGSQGRFIERERCLLT